MNYSCPVSTILCLHWCSGKFGLWLDGDLNCGRTESCKTYGNDPLVPESDFVVNAIECWTFGRDE